MVTPERWRQVPSEEERLTMCTGIANALFQKWEQGREKYGDKFVGDPDEQGLLEDFDSIVYRLYSRMLKNELEERIAELEAENNELRARLHRLEAR